MNAKQRLFVAAKVFEGLSDKEIQETIARIRGARRQTAADKRELQMLIDIQRKRSEEAN